MSAAREASAAGPGDFGSSFIIVQIAMTSATYHRLFTFLRASRKDAENHDRLVAISIQRKRSHAFVVGRRRRRPRESSQAAGSARRQRRLLEVGGRSNPCQGQLYSPPPELVRMEGARQLC